MSKRVSFRGPGTGQLPVTCWLIRGLGVGLAAAAVASAAEPPAPGAAPEGQVAKTAFVPGALPLTVPDAILQALQHNRALAVQKLNPDIRRTFEQQARAQFDPSLTVEGTLQRSRSSSGSGSVFAQDKQARATLHELLPFGTQIQLGGGAGLAESSPGSEDQYSTNLSITVTQPLLQGAGLGVNLASLRQAGIDTRYSEYELRGLVQTLVADTEGAYWDLYLARRQVAITHDSLDLATRQLEDTRERIRLGKLAGSELAAAEAEAALRREDVINAESSAAVRRLALVRLLSPPGARLWYTDFRLLDAPGTPVLPPGDLDTYLSAARLMRPELNQARLQIQRNELELVKTRNGLLPRLDLFVSYGKTGYAASFGDARRDLNGQNYDLSAGVTIEIPLGNRAARAQNTRATFSREQAGLALENLTQLAEMDVQTAYLEVQRTSEQVGATAATRRLQEEKLRNETEKFRVGKSTTLLVGQAQRDLLVSQISEAVVAVNYLKACTELRRQDGSLLEFRGIDCAGKTPVILPGE